MAAGLWLLALSSWCSSSCWLRPRQQAGLRKRALSCQCVTWPVAESTCKALRSKALTKSLLAVVHTYFRIKRSGGLFWSSVLIVSSKQHPHQGSARVAFWGRPCHKSVLGYGRPDTCSHICILFRGLTKTTAFILAVGDLGKMLGLLLTSACCWTDVCWIHRVQSTSEESASFGVGGLNICVEPLFRTYWLIFWWSINAYWFWWGNTRDEAILLSLDASSDKVWQKFCNKYSIK